MPSDDLSTGATEVRSSLLAHFCDVAGSSASREELAELVDRVLAEVSSVNEHAPCVGTARAIRSGRASGSTCTLIGTVAGVSHPEILLSGDKQIEFVTVRLLDGSGEEVPLLPVVDALHAETLLEAGKKGVPVSVSGLVLAIPKATTHRRSGDLRQGTRVGAVFISKVEKAYSHLDAMGASEEERELASVSIRKAGGNGIKLLCEAVTHRLGLVELERQSELLKWVAIQSMGCGQIGHTPGTIHLCAIGAPASGKKILSVAAEILNPVSEQIMPGRTSLAGLMGPSVRTSSGWSFEPGALTRAAGGVAIMQDAHVWSANDLRELAPILQHIMEDGQVRAAGIAGGRTISARTSLLLDANRTTDILGRGRPAPILMELPLLSRIDLLLGMSSTAAESWKHSAKLLAPIDATFATRSNARLIPAVVATLRDSHPAVALQNVWGTLKSGYENLFDEFEEFFAGHDEIANALSKRTAVSVQKLCAAISRGADSSVATEEHATLALGAVREKLNFVRDHVARLSTCPAGSPDVQHWLSTQAGESSPTELAERFRKETGHTVSERTVRRHLVHMACSRTGKGLYRLPANKEGE